MDLLEYWYAALHSEHGVVVESDDIDRLQALLYQARQKAGDSALANLSLVKSPVVANQIWIYRRVKEKIPDPTPEDHT